MYTRQGVLSAWQLNVTQVTAAVGAVSRVSAAQSGVPVPAQKISLSLSPPNRCVPGLTSLALSYRMSRATPS